MKPALRGNRWPFIRASDALALRLPARAGHSASANQTIAILMTIWNNIDNTVQYVQFIETHPILTILQYSILYCRQYDVQVYKQY